MVQSPPTGLDEAAKVEELIDHDRKGWNVQLTDEIFNEDDQRAIKVVPISSSNQPGELVWRGMKNGVFSVSSAYYMVKEMEIETQSESSIRRGQSDLWKGIWNMRSPNVVKKNYVEGLQKSFTNERELNEEEGSRGAIMSHMHVGG
jgi:hypothetical protein